jgi:type II secretory pathway pseudopilin PulG
MVFKTLKVQKGFTLFELIIIIATLSIFLSGTLILVKPAQLFKRGRDQKRLSDISAIERAFSEYLLDNNTFPDSADTSRTSTILPDGNSGPLENPASGWLSDVSSYITKLPTDPLNNEAYFYSYQHTGSTFELNARLETLLDLAQNDGGNDSAVYEIGTDLTIL